MLLKKNMLFGAFSIRIVLAGFYFMVYLLVSFIFQLQYSIIGGAEYSSIKFVKFHCCVSCV